MTPAVSTIIDALGGNLTTGMCRCPAHDDRNPSLHVTQGQCGKLLVKCHAGCSQDDVIAALKRQGVWPKTANHKLKPRHDDAEEEDERLIKAHGIVRVAAEAKARPPSDYLRGRGINIVPPCAKILPADESLQMLDKNFPAMVCHVTDGKKFLGAHVTWLTRDTKAKCTARNPRRFYGNVKGGYVPLSKPDPAKPLIVGEGIETTLSAMQLSDLPGIAALSASIMPAVKIPPCTSVIIAADHDDAGRKAAEQLASRLEFEAIKVQIAFPPIEGADWNDRLREADDARAEWQAALAADNPDARRRPIGALDEAEFMALEFPQRSLILSPWLPRAALAMIHAPRGEGKTWFALAIGKAIANGENLLGWSCLNSAKVLYVDGELPGQFLQDRLKKFPASPSGMFHLLCRDTYLLNKQAMPDLGEPKGRQELDRVIAECEPSVVIFDSISTLVRTGQENEAESWAPVQDWLLEHRWQGRTIILVHHEGKSGKPRGSSKREDVLDTMIGLKRRAEDSSDKDSVFELTFTKARDFYGADAASMLIKLSITDGGVNWRHELVRDAQRDKVRELKDAGFKQKQIAKELGITPGRVSQIVKGMQDHKVTISRDVEV